MKSPRLQALLILIGTCILLGAVAYGYRWYTLQYNPENEIATAKENWQDNRVQNYQLTVRHRDQNATDTIEYVLMVENSELSSVETTCVNNDDCEFESIASTLTIDGLFDKAEKLASRDEAGMVFNISFHDDYYFPRAFGLYDENNDISIEFVNITNFEIIPAP